MATLKENMEAIKLEKDTKILPENLKSGITAFGVEGTMQAGIDTSDATATANDIVQGATAYVNGEKIEGNLIFASTLDNRNEDETVKNQPFTQVYDFNGETYFDMNVEASRMRGDMEYVDRAALDLNYSGGHNLVIAIGDKASNVANAIGLTSDKIVAGNIILGVEGTAETVATTMIMELGKTYIVEFKQNVDESINVAEQMAGDAIKINGFDGIYLMLGDAGFNAGYHNVMYEGETESITLIRGYMDQSTIDLVKAAFGEDNVIIDDTTRGWKQICGSTTTNLKIESIGYINPIMIKPGQIFYNGETVTSGSIDLSSYSWLIESIKEI